MSVEFKLQTLLNTVPVGPRAGVKTDDEGKVIISPFSFEQLGDRIKIHLPANYENFKDDPMFLCFSAACFLFESREILADATDVVAADLLDAASRTQERKLYFAGVLDALRKGKHIEYQRNHTGSYGKGWNWVAHKSLESTKVPSECIRGKHIGPGEILQGIVWKKGIESIRQRIITFIVKACQEIKLAKPCTFFKTQNELRGIRTKMSVPWDNQGGIITKTENEILKNRFEKEIGAYSTAKDQLTDAKVSIMTSAQYIQALDRLLTASKGIKPAVDQYERIARLRFDLLEKDIPKGKLKKERSKKLEERIQEMDVDNYVAIFHPAFVWEQRVLNLRQDNRNNAMRYFSVDKAIEYIQDVFEPLFSQAWPQELKSAMITWLDVLYDGRRPHEI